MDWILFAKYIAGLLLACTFWYWENKCIKISRHVIESEDIPDDLDGLRIAHVSDIQSNEFGKKQSYIRNALDKIKPNMIFFTGDLIDRNHTDVGKSLRVAEVMADVAPTFFVDGNHELMAKYSHVAKMYKGMEELPITKLLDEKFSIVVGKTLINIGGISEKTIFESKQAHGRLSKDWDRQHISDAVDSIFGIVDSKDAAKERRDRDASDDRTNEATSCNCLFVASLDEISNGYFDRLSNFGRLSKKDGSCGLEERGIFTFDLHKKQIKNSFNILLAHEPQMIESYKKDYLNLIFSGHAHGGQVRLPFTDGLFAPNQGKLPKLASGMRTYGRSKLIISRGLGNSVIPLRIFNRPEIIEVVLKKKR